MSDQTWSRLMNAIIDEGYLPKMKGCAAQVYMALLRHSDFELKDVRPSIDRLCNLTGAARSPVKRALKNLAELGLIEIVQQSHNSKGKMANLYILNKFNDLPHGSFSTHGEGSISDHAYGSFLDQPTVQKRTTNNTKRTTPNTTTEAPIKRRIIQEEYFEPQQSVNLDDAVVAILKQLKVDQNFWPSLQGMEINRVQALADLAKQKAKKNPGGWFRSAVEGGWDVPGFDKKAFEMQCDLIRKTATHLVSKTTGKEYEIDRFKTGDKIVIHVEDRGDVVLSNEQELAQFTWVA